MQTFTDQSAPATAAEFKRAVVRGFKAANPGSVLVFTSRVRRFEKRADQPEGTVSFAVEFRAAIGDAIEDFVADSFRYGGHDRERRTGSGHVSASPKGCRSVW